MKTVAQHIPAYSYGTAQVPKSPVSMREFVELQTSAGFPDEELRYLRLAGEVLRGQTRQIVEHRRAGIIAGIPNLARHSRAPEGDVLPEYLAKSNLRFEQWILDTCLRAYDQDWINYQQEIALRHTSTKKNQTDSVQLNAVRAAARHYRVRHGAERDDPAVSCRQGQHCRGGRRDASGVVQVAASATRALDARVFRPRRMVTNETQTFY